MNIVVCIKQVTVPKSPIEIDRDKKTIIEEGVGFFLNPCDEIATEEALRIKEKTGKGKIIVITMGPERTERALRTCLAMGADEAIRLWDDAFVGSDFYATATILAKAIAALPYDLIFCGCQTADDESGLVGVYIAEILGVPQVSSVRKIDLSPGAKRMIVHRKVEKFTEVVESPLPALLTIQGGHRPRYPTLPARLDSFEKKITTYDLAKLGLSATSVGIEGSTTRIVSISPPKPRKKAELFIDRDLSAGQKMMMVMSGGVQAKKDDNSNILDGAPHESASKVVEYCSKILGE